MLSGRGLCDELITRPEESYRLWCVVVCDLETSRISAPYIHDISSLRVNKALEKIIRDANIKQLGNIFYKSVQILAYADDIDIISRSSKFSPPSTLLPFPQLQTLANPKNAVLLSRC